MSKLVIIIISIFLIFIISIFYFLPRGTIHFVNSGNSNFSLTDENQMQFYPNMRFANSNISYRISNCTLKKQNDMQSAFSIIENITLLNFYPTNSNEEIFVTCDEKLKSEGNLFIAGEGGPTSIISAGNFNVILKGRILLIKKSDCPTPNVAIHELFHVLGFEHSLNKNNVMYNITDCSQTIGDDVVSLLNKLYSVQSYPDLAFGNVSAVMNGMFLDINMSVMNEGLQNSKESVILIYSNENLLKEINLEPLDIGKGKLISIQNIFVLEKTDLIELTINSSYEEISKENNKIKLEIKN